MSDRDELAILILNHPLMAAPGYDLFTVTSELADAVIARWRLVPVESDCDHPQVTADRKPDGSADIRCLVCGFSGRIMHADYAAQIAALRPY